MQMVGADRDRLMMRVVRRPLTSCRHARRRKNRIEVRTVRTLAQGSHGSTPPTDLQPPAIVRRLPRRQLDIGFNREVGMLTT